MQTNSKPGLADLKRLRQQALEAPVPAPPTPRRRGAAASAGESTGQMGRKSAPRESGGVRPKMVQGAPEAASAPLAAEDRALFRQAVKSVQPLTPSNRAVLPPVPVAPDRILKERRQAASGTEAPAPAPVSDHYASPLLAPDASHFVQAGHGPDLLKGLARGKWPIGASLDLHGANLDEARQRLDGFLRSCLQHGVRCVRIVHGKGYGSKNNAPVLKDTARRWLTQLDDVMAYTECAERDGGSGAVLVLLRAGKDHGV
ncbi:Smr/MutS family protein [Pusillimonas noertemannii]|uniref:Smr/MutS family protein n=1 Tax=Pusillimonas noertemannii TaxID=305977 RepID=UPI0002F7BD5B|nr:Smr/MutS family protein [Pusillimonas noertemannii]